MSLGGGGHVHKMEETKRRSKKEKENIQENKKCSIDVKMNKIIAKWCKGNKIGTARERKNIIFRAGENGFRTDV
jgi:hypothetical protein